jgi:hypothetical protein
MRLRAVQDFQRRANLARMLVPLAGRARETTLHDGANARWHVRWELRKRGLQDGRSCGGRHPFGKGPVPRRHLIQHDPERPDVAQRRRGLAVHHFGRHVRERPWCAAFPTRFERRVLAGRGVDGRRNAEVEDFDATVRCDHHIAALQIAMDDAALVGMRQGVGDLCAVACDRIDGHPTRRNQGGQRPSLDALHDDEGAFVYRDDLVHGANVRMVETRGAARLLQEALLFVLVREDGTGEELDRDVALQSMVAREVDGAHPTFAEPGEDFVITESRSVLHSHRESQCSAERGPAMNARVMAFS